MQKHKHTYGCTLGSQAHHAYSLEDHTRSIQQTTSTHTNNVLRYENFAIEWSSYIEQFVEVREELLIVGDFNIHVDSSNNESKGFLDILNANGLTQHVTSPTHRDTR